jgi:hypothetical protein
LWNTIFGHKKQKWQKAGEKGVIDELHTLSSIPDITGIVKWRRGVGHIVCMPENRHRNASRFSSEMEPFGI